MQLNLNYRPRKFADEIEEEEIANQSQGHLAPSILTENEQRCTFEVAYFISKGMAIAKMAAVCELEQKHRVDSGSGHRCMLMCHLSCMLLTGGHNSKFYSASVNIITSAATRRPTTHLLRNGPELI